MRRRAIVFLCLAIVIFFISQMFFDGELGLAIAVIFSLIYAFFPTAVSYIIALVPVVPLTGILIAETLLYAAFVIAICLVEVGIAIGIYAIAGFVLIGGGHRLMDMTGASLGTIIFVAIILFSVRGSYSITRKIVSDTWLEVWAWGWSISEQWFPFPGRLISKIWEMAGKLGELSGGNIYP